MNTTKLKHALFWKDVCKAPSTNVKSFTGMQLPIFLQPIDISQTSMQQNVHVQNETLPVYAYNINAPHSAENHTVNERTLT